MERADGAGDCGWPWEGRPAGAEVAVPGGRDPVVDDPGAEVVGDPCPDPWALLVEAGGLVGCVGPEDAPTPRELPGESTGCVAVAPEPLASTAGAEALAPGDDGAPWQPAASAVIVASPAAIGALLPRTAPPMVPRAQSPRTPPHVINRSLCVTMPLVCSLRSVINPLHAVHSVL